MIPQVKNDSIIVKTAIVIILLSTFSVIALEFKFLALLGAIVVLYFSLKNKIFLFCFFLAVTPFIMHWFWPYLGTSELIFTILIIFLWILRVMINGNTYSRACPFLVVFPTILILFAFISALNNGITFHELKFLILYTIFFIFAYSFYDIYQPKSTLIIWASATFPVFIGSVQQLLLYSHVNGLFDLLNLYRIKPSALFQNVNSFGAAVIAVIPFWLALAVWSQRKLLKRIASFISFILILGLIFANARAALVGFSVSMIAFFIRAKKMKYMVGGIAIICLLFILLPSISEIFMFALRLDYGTSFRDVLWKNSLDIIRHNMVLGIGIGNFQETIFPYLETFYLRNTWGMFFHAHNFVLNTTVNLGLLGFILSIWIYYLSFSEGIKALDRAKNPEDKAMIFGIYGSVLALVGWSIFETGWILGFGWPYPDILFWIPFIMLLKINLTPKGFENGIILN